MVWSEAALAPCAYLALSSYVVAWWRAVHLEEATVARRTSGADSAECSRPE